MDTKKSAKKEAAKKEAAKKEVPRKKLPSKALVRDLAAVLEAHNWSGAGIRFAAGAERRLAAGASRCPDGKIPVVFVFEDDDGRQVTRTVCVDP